MKGKLLWVGDAVAATGFSRITHHVVEVLREQWQVHVLGINHWGDPTGAYDGLEYRHGFDYPVLPAARGFADDPFGFNRLGKVTTKIKPDVIVCLTDPWHVPKYLQGAGNCPVIASVMVDGLNCRGTGLNGTIATIFCTEFGLEQAKLGGYQGRAAVIPLGVDLEIYKPIEQAHARASLGLPPALHEHGFIVGNVNRNQPRKRLDLTLRWFAEWVREYDRGDAYLYLHVAPTGDQGWDIGQLAQYYGIASRLIFAEPDIMEGVTEQALARIYSAFDVQVTTTQGEGFGLTTLEGMACGVPQIVPAWAALGELCGDAALQVTCTSTAATPNNINVIGGIPDREEFIACLDRVYTDQATREQLRARGIALANEDCYRWRQVGELYASVIDQAINPVTRLGGGTAQRQRDGDHEAAGPRADAAQTASGGEEST